MKLKKTRQDYKNEGELIKAENRSEVTANNGVREISVTKKALKNVYGARGFTEGSLEDTYEDSETETLSPQARAAATRKANAELAAKELTDSKIAK